MPATGDPVPDTGQPFRLMRISSELRHVAAAGALSALLFAAGVLLPLLGPPAGFFSTAPLIWLAARHGPQAGLLGGMLAAAGLLPALPPPVVLIFSLEHVLPAWYLGWNLRRGKGIVAGSTAAALVVTTLMIGIALMLSERGHNPLDVLEHQLRSGLAELAEPPPDQADSLGANLEEVLSQLRRVLPAVTLIGIFIECSLNSLLAARMLPGERGGGRALELTTLRLPEWLVWVLIPSLALCWTPQPAVSTSALNVAASLMFIYLVQGLSITLHLAARSRLHRFGRIALMSAFAIFPWLLAGPLLLGLLDFRFSFRDRWPLERPPDA